MLLIVWIYNSKPFLLSRKPFASLIILALSYSTIPLLYGYYLNLGLKINNYFIYLIIFWFLIRISVSILKDYKDEVGDKIYSKKTFYLVFGNKRTALVSVLFFCLGSLGIIYMLFMIRGISFLFILPIIFFFKNLYLRLQLFKTSEVKKLTYIFHKIFFGQNQFDLMLLLCLIFLK